MDDTKTQSADAGQTQCARPPARSLQGRSRAPLACRSTRHGVRYALCALLMLGAVSAGDPPATPLSETQVSKAFAKRVKQELGALRKSTLQSVLVLKTDLDQLGDEFESGSLSKADLADDLLDTLENFVRTLTGLSFGSAVSLGTAAEELLAQSPDLAELPEDFQIGAGGAADQVAMLVERHVMRAERKACGLIDRFRTKRIEPQGLALNVILNPTRHTQPLAPVLGDSAVELVNFPFSIEVLIALSDSSVSNDGLLGFALLVPGNQGDQLMSILIGQDSLFEIAGPWVVDGGRTRGILGTGVGLAESSYKLVLDRLGTQVSRSITVP